MAAKVRRQYAGAAAQTSITSSITSGDTSVSIASTTGWPSTALVPFYVVIDPDTSVEEKCSVTISGSTLTLTRGVDGTVAAAHSSGATIYPVFTATDADEANELASKFTAKGDIVTQGASTFTTTTVGTNDQLLKADSSAAGGVAWATYSPVITLGGDLSGSVTLTNLGSGTLTATVAANSVALGTDTTGNYVSDVTAGTGITVTHTPGEGSSAAVAIDGTVATLTGSQTLTNKTIALGSNTVSGTKAEFDTAVTDDNFAYVGTANTFTTNQVISASSSSDLLRITQTGAGNALVVEDTTNPDSTPFLIDQTGNIVTGHTSALSTIGYSGFATTPKLQLQGTSGTTAGFGITNWANNSASSPQIIFSKSMSGTIGTAGTTAANNDLGAIVFAGDDGTSFARSALIFAEVEGTVSTGIVPGRLMFNTADSAGTLTERMRIDSAGQVGIGATPLAGRNLTVGKTLTGGTTAFGIVMNGVAQSDVTVAVQGFRSAMGTAAASFTLPIAYHFFATQGTFGAGSTVTTQAGYTVDSGMTGATNNYGFYGTLAVATGRFNLYMEGTAANYLAGRLGVGAALTSGAMAQVTNTTAADKAFVVKGAASQSGLLLDVQNSAGTSLTVIDSSGRVGVGTAPNAAVALDLRKTITGGTTAYGVFQAGAIQSDVTSTAHGYSTSLSTQAAAFTLTNLIHYRAIQSTIGATSTVTSQYGFWVDATLTGATSNYGFFGNIASGSNRWNLYMEGTARNYLAGGLEVVAGTTSMTAGFTHVPSAAGVPTGVPTNPTGNTPLYYDTTNNKLYAYNGGWKSVTLS